MPGCCAAALRRAARDGEPAAERERKQLLLPTALAVIPVSVAWSAACAWGCWRWADAGGGDARPGGPTVPNVGYAGVWLSCAGFTASASAVLITRRLTVRGVEVVVAVLTACCVLSDWGGAQFGHAEVWPNGVVLMDILLCTGASGRTTRGVLGAFVAWVVVRSFEDAYRIGLYDFPYSTGKAPDAQPNQLLNMMAKRLVPFLLDFWFTRKFATEVRGCVELSQRLAQALARYDLDTAEAAMGSEGAQKLPEELRDAYNAIISNLSSFKPYLPQSVLAQQHLGSSFSAQDNYDVEPPRGDVAICFSDIVGSTALWESAPEAMEDALSLHNGVIRGQIRAYGGYEVKTIGDSFMVSFASAASAVLFGLGVQEGLLVAPWAVVPEFGPASDTWLPRADPATGELLWNGLAVRVGVAYGDVKDETNPVTGRLDYRGRAVNLASRCESSAPRGAVNVSEACGTAAEREGDPRMAAVELLPLPAVDMKGIGRVQTFAAVRGRLRGRVGYFAESRQMSGWDLGAADKSAGLGNGTPPGMFAPEPVANLQASGRRSPFSRVGTPADAQSTAGSGLGSTLNTQQAWSSVRRSESDRVGPQTDVTIAAGGLRPALIPRPLHERTSARAVSETVRGEPHVLPADPERSPCFNLGLAAHVGSVAAVARLDGGATDHTAAAPAEAGAALNAALSHCVGAVLRTRGKLGAVGLFSVAGAAAHAAWNVVTPCVGHDAMVLRFAALLLGGAQCAATAGVASGPLLHGNVGTARQRFHVVVGFAPRAACAAAADAARRRVPCLAAYLGAAPDTVRGQLRPVDTWGLAAGAGGGAGQRVAVEQPDCDGDPRDTFTDSRDGAPGSRYRALYRRALEDGSRDALRELEGLAAGDDLLEGVGAELREHQRAHPDGAAWRVAAMPTAAPPPRRRSADGGSAAPTHTIGGVLHVAREEQRRRDAAQMVERERSREQHVTRLHDRQQKRRASAGAVVGGGAGDDAAAAGPAAVPPARSES